MMTKINHFVAPLKGSLNDNIECSNQQKKIHSIKPNLTRKRIGLLKKGLMQKEWLNSHMLLTFKDSIRTPPC